MITSVVVTYRVLPEAVAEHVRLIEAVFEQLRSEKPTGVLDYQVRCLEDGVSFVHVSTADTSDGSNPLPKRIWLSICAIVLIIMCPFF